MMVFTNVTGYSQLEIEVFTRANIYTRVNNFHSIYHTIVYSQKAFSKHPSFTVNWNKTETRFRDKTKTYGDINILYI